LNPDNFEVGPYHYKGFKILTPMYTFEKEIIWGITARILEHLFSVLQTGKEHHNSEIKEL